MNLKKTFIWFFRIILLIFIYFPIWILGSMVMGDSMQGLSSEPGLLSQEVGAFVLAIINTFLILALILTSRWRGWRLALFLALAYYGSFTFLTQIETWYFLKDLTVSSDLLPRLFIMGLSVPFVYIPLAVLICKRWKKNDVATVKIEFMPIRQLILKLGVIAIVYLVIYWLAGYYIAWQNPELRAFYGSPGEIQPFFTHAFAQISENPGLILLQLFRGMLFVIIVIPIIIGSNVKPWATALLVGLLFAIPHLGHILPNPLMPVASVRLSHMIETSTSTFVFGLIVVWLLHRKK
ncbi:MAG TPA: hypothetical protein PLW77_03760 [Bacteroidales bacterium]|nr:hypothetical protein [Bacteroidales bacterium]HQB21375.1 hypothetical protein [Bacteroidales bacterium]